VGAFQSFPSNPDSLDRPFFFLANDSTVVQALATWSPKFGGLCGLVGFEGGATDAPFSDEAIAELIKEHPPATQIHVWVAIAVWPGNAVAVPVAAETYLSETGYKPNSEWYVKRNTLLLEILSALRCPVLGFSNDCEAASFSALQQVSFPIDNSAIFSMH